MITAAAFLGFLIAIIPITVTPGASFTLVSSRGLIGDHRGAWATIAGTAAGIFTHAVLGGVGLAAVVMQSAQLYAVIRLIGAAYLVGLGLHLVWRSRRGKALETPTADAPVGTRRHLWRAYVANVLNVKAASVYLMLAPQFIASSAVGVASMLQLAAIHSAVMTVWLGLWTLGLKQLTARFDPQLWRRRIDAVGGLVLVALGIRTAVQPR